MCGEREGFLLKGRVSASLLGAEYILKGRFRVRSLKDSLSLFISSSVYIVNSFVTDNFCRQHFVTGNGKKLQE
jgi:hypothetical protein